MKHGITIDFEIADKIAVEVLLEAVDRLKKQMINHENGGWMHEDDVKLNKKFIKKMTFILEHYFGVTMTKDQDERTN